MPLGRADIPLDRDIVLSTIARVVIAGALLIGAASCAAASATVETDPLDQREPAIDLGVVPTPPDGAGTPEIDGKVDLGGPPVPDFDPSTIDPANFPGQGVGDAPPEYFVYPDD